MPHHIGFSSTVLAAGGRAALVIGLMVSPLTSVPGEDPPAQGMGDVGPAPAPSPAPAPGPAPQPGVPSVQPGHHASTPPSHVHDTHSGPGSAAASDADASEGNDLEAFADLPVVISASRQRTTIDETPVPVAVVTADDLHYGGAQNLANALRQVPGVEVLNFDRNWPAVGVRGLAEIFSDRTLTLIDGRPADNVVYGGYQLERQPLFMDDIDRVEVVLGPGGAAWGANAFNGVINVITKRPDQELGTLLTSSVDQYGDSSTEVRTAETDGNWSWRISAGGADNQSSASALDHPDITADDFSRSGTIDTAADYHIDDHTRLEFGLGYMDITEGNIEFIGYQPNSEAHSLTTRAYSKLDHHISQDELGYSLQWYGNFTNIDVPSIDHTISRENGVDAQLDLPTWNRQHLSIGADARRTDINVEGSDPQEVSIPITPETEYRAGVFLVDSIDVTRQITFDLEGRADRYTGTQNDWSGRASVLYAVDRDHRNVLRLSGARSYRTPLLDLQDASTVRTVPPPFPPVPVFELLPPTSSLRDEQIRSLEVGWSCRPIDPLLFRTDLYYQRYQDLIGYDFTFTPQPPFPALETARPADVGGASAYGGSEKVDYTFRHGRAYLWYSYNGFHIDQPGQNVRAFLPARHMVGAGIRHDLPYELIGSIDYHFSSPVVLPPQPGEDSVVPSCNILDMTVSRKFANQHAELMIGVDDLLDQSGRPVQGIAQNTSHLTPGRTVFLRGSLTF